MPEAFRGTTRPVGALRQSIGGAQIAGLGEAPHGTAEITHLKQCAAENVRWWHGFTRNKVIYWAASAHTANAPHLRVTLPPGTGRLVRRSAPH
ncbi:erythromycin esterase family protein [Kribbella shirazensis]|uniref:Erythromycin esterase-like protein n=1 Tax=Kribbella shirazensis TaxID=1105143 RepID=A0A7X5ZY15_9ACTN|nr:erythromycin esterase family protein [Kribbella shirazensis]NIK54468.1 erythromycin esterase-like protein [Kribbella shirazensis]